jgi:hypothetical protein
VLRSTLKAESLKALSLLFNEAEKRASSGCIYGTSGVNETGAHSPLVSVYLMTHNNSHFVVPSNRMNMKNWKGYGRVERNEREPQSR